MSRLKSFLGVWFELGAIVIAAIAIVAGESRGEGIDDPGAGLEEKIFFVSGCCVDSVFTRLDRHPGAPYRVLKSKDGVAGKFVIVPVILEPTELAARGAKLVVDSVLVDKRPVPIDQVLDVSQLEVDEGTDGAFYRLPHGVSKTLTVKNYLGKQALVWIRFIATHSCPPHPGTHTAMNVTATLIIDPSGQGGGDD
jgi:hypothetical protein